MYTERISLYKQLEEEFNSKLIIYITSDRNNMGAQIANDVLDLFVEHLDNIGVQPKISLYLYTVGGDVAAAWSLVNLLRIYCDELEVIVPNKAHSAGTIISIGADRIIMTKQATLSPIDPSLNTPLNPIIPNGFGTSPVSVEAVKGYLEIAEKELNIHDETALAQIIMKLTEYIHPLVLGQVFRSKSQIQMLAKKLLINQVDDDEKIEKIVSFLCSESGSHDYTINRREAERDLELKVVKPTDAQYRLIKDIYDDIKSELLFNYSFNFDTINGSYAVRRAIIESVHGGADYFITEGRVETINNNGNLLKHNAISFEGWRHQQLNTANIVSDQENGGASYEEGNGFSL